MENEGAGGGERSTGNWAPVLLVRVTEWPGGQGVTVGSQAPDTEEGVDMV